MDYEAPDGSQFSLWPIWKEGPTGDPVFDYTNVTAYVDGVAYTSRLDDPPDEVDEGDLLASLEPVPLECIHPSFPAGFTLAPSFDSLHHYHKAPSFTYEDCKPGNTFVADCVLNEVSVLERLRSHPHSNVVAYQGCVVDKGRITHICLQRYPTNLVNYALVGLQDDQRAKIISGVRSGISHLHSLGLSHNDINPDNICIDGRGEAIIIDFDSCLPFGEPLLKGCAYQTDGRPPTSTKDNDLEGIRTIEVFLQSSYPGHDGIDDSDKDLEDRSVER